MGYDLHICTVPDWLEASAHPLSRERWESVVSADPELAVSSDDYVAFSADDGTVVRTPAVIWLSHDDVAFWFGDGEVTVKNPDDETIVKMLHLARQLGCFVVGDEGERYTLHPSSPGWRAAALGDVDPATGYAP